MRERGNALLHLLDRYVGIPVVASLGALRRKRAIPSKIRTIGLLKTGAIGDTVLMSGPLLDLRAAYPDSTLIFFAGRSNLEIARMLEGLDRVIEVPVKNPLEGIRTVRSLPVDVLLDFGQWSRLEGLFSACSRARCTIGFRTRGQHRHHAYDIAVEHSNRIHELENFRLLVRPLGVHTTHPPKLRASESPPPIRQQYAVFHLWPGGFRSELKEWPAESWLQLVRDVCVHGVHVVLTGGPADRARNAKLIESLPPDSRRKAKNAAGASLEETTAILRGARLVVSVNTGVMHMAAALGAPLVALHGPTPSSRWGPVSANATVIDSPLPGCPYLNLGSEYRPNPPKCMEAIPYESVRDACEMILASETTGATRAEGPSAIAKPRNTKNP